MSSTRAYCTCHVVSTPARPHLSGKPCQAATFCQNALIKFMLGSCSLQLSAALEQDFHFRALPGNKWGLAVYQPLRWGLAGASSIAADFAEILALVPGVQLVAVAVRSQDRLPQAQAFADKHGTLSTSVAWECWSLIHSLNIASVYWLCYPKQQCIQRSLSLRVAYSNCGF